MHARVVVYKFKAGTLDSAIRKAETEVLSLFRKRAGYRSYQVVKTGPDGAISISMWDTEAHAKGAAKAAADWVKANMAGDVVSADPHLGVVAFSHR